MAQSVQRKSVRYNHETIVDLMILHPGITQNEIADELGYAVSTVSIVCNSDMFITYKRQRLAEHHKAVSTETIQKVEGLTNLSLDVIHERIEAERGKIELAAPFKAAEMGLEALGFGQKARTGGAATPAANLNVFVNAADLSRARGKMRDAADTHSHPPEPPADPAKQQVLMLDDDDAPTVEVIDAMPVPVTP